MVITVIYSYDPGVFNYRMRANGHKDEGCHGLHFIFVLYSFICFILFATLTSQTISPVNGRILDDTQGERTLQSAGAERPVELRHPFCQSEQEKEMRH